MSDRELFHLKVGELDTSAVINNFELQSLMKKKLCNINLSKFKEEDFTDREK